MFARRGLSIDPAPFPALPEYSAKSNYSRTYAKQGVYPLAIRFSALVAGHWSLFGIFRTVTTKKKKPRGLPQPRSLLQTRRGECRADQLLMSVLASSFASMGSRNTLLASGATAMEAFISLEAVAKSPVCDARRACARWLSQ